MRSTSNIVKSYVTGSPLPAPAVVDTEDLVSTADDDAFYDIFKLEPPAAASLTNVRVGFAPLRNGPFIVGDGAARTVTVKPMRVARSSGDNALPRSLLSGVINADTLSNAIPAAPGAGLYGWEVIYAQLAYIDSTNPSKGTQVTLAWGTSPTYVVFANPGNFGTVPANTNTSWNIPIAYLRNYFGQTTIAAEDLIEVAPLTSGSPAFIDARQLRITSARSGVDARRGYSSADNDPSKLTSGSTSKWQAVGLAQALTKTITPVVTGRSNVENVRREIIIPPCGAGSGGGTAGTGGGVVANLVLDDSRDWRCANFDFKAWVGNDGQHWGEEDTTTANRNFPILRDTVVATNPLGLYMSCGQSWVATQPHATVYDARLWVGIIGVDADVQGSGPRNGAAAYLGAGSGWGVYVDGTTGALCFYAKRAAALQGPAIWMLIDAWFGNHAP